jgi:hypothetical protein
MYDAGKLVAVPKEQNALRRIRELRAEGLSPRKISAALASQGVKLSHVTIRKVIASRR